MSSESKKKSRYITVADTNLLITKAGGRCSFNSDNEFCHTLLADGRVIIGERAHIIGVNGPRARESDVEFLNNYENLIWLCPKHHKIIDHKENHSIYTEAKLLAMKKRHESYIANGVFPYYGTEGSNHDYSVLSAIFHFIDIHRLYSCVASYPDIHLDFFEVGENIQLLREDNPDALPLKDPILRWNLNNLIYCHKKLESALEERTDVDQNRYTRIFKFKENREGHIYVFRYLIVCERILDIIQKRFPQIMHQQQFDAGLSD